MKQEIINKIQSIKKEFSFLKDESDDYVLNAVVTQALFYKNPSYPLLESDLKKIIVDGKNDGGIDCILTDNDSDYSDIVFIQCKCYDSISLEQIKAALDKMYGAYLNLEDKKFSYFKDDLVSQYSASNFNMEDNAKTRFVFCTTAPQSGTKIKSITNYFSSIISDNTNIKLDILFEKELIEKIVEFDSLRRTVSNGKIKLDASDNYLQYFESNGDEEDAIIINGSAYSIKNLYSMHHLALFSQNLRYFVKSKNIDSDIKKSIDSFKKKFWYKNNGITIICDKFEVSGRELHLYNFSIINGGQTTTLIGNHDAINEDNDFYLPIKIIKKQGENEEEKQNFVFDIAIATNSQKAIKPADLKANEPEQILFANELRNIGVFYRTKRGEPIPTNFNAKDKNLDLPKASKLGLAGIYLMPGTSRSKPSIIYSDDTSFYEGIFVKNKTNTARCIKDLLYIDNYFDTDFKKDYQRKTKVLKRVTFANNSRTLCLAYCGFLSKYINNDFTDDDISYLCNFDSKDEKEVKKVQKILSTSSNLQGILSKGAYENLDELESKLYKVFSFIIKAGDTIYQSVSAEDAVDESGWLKKDLSFYTILASSIDELNEELEENADLYTIFKRD